MAQSPHTVHSWGPGIWKLLGIRCHIQSVFGTARGKTLESSNGSYYYLTMILSITLYQYQEQQKMCFFKFSLLTSVPYILNPLHQNRVIYTVT